MEKLKAFVDERNHLGVIIDGTMISYWANLMIYYDVGKGYCFFKPISEILDEVYNLINSYDFTESEKEKFIELAVKKFYEKDSIIMDVKEKLELGKKQLGLLPDPNVKYVITEVEYAKETFKINANSSESERKDTIYKITNVKIEKGKKELDKDEYSDFAENLYIPNEILHSKVFKDIILSFIESVKKFLKRQNCYRDVFVQSPLYFSDSIQRAWFFEDGIPNDLPKGKPDSFVPLYMVPPSKEYWIWANKDDRDIFMKFFHEFVLFE